MSANLVDHLSAFLAVAETGSFSVAARNLGRAVSSVSYSIAQLEAQCGFPLLNRRIKRSELTERGLALLSEAKAVVEGARRFGSHASSLERGAETRIRIAVDPLFPLAALHAALRTFAAAHDHAQLQFFNSSLNNLWDQLRSGHLDFALSPVAGIPLDMRGHSFKQLMLGPVASASHPLAALDRPLLLSDLQRERQIYFVGSPDLPVERVGRVFSLDLWTGNDLEHIRLLIRNGFGWCFGTQEFFCAELRAGLVRMLPCRDAQLQPIRTISAIWPAERPPGPLGLELIRLVGASILSDNMDEPTTLLNLRDTSECPSFVSTTENATLIESACAPPAAVELVRDQERATTGRASRPMRRRKIGPTVERSPT
jgi:DNA-binding transcriptional LysR family regulator